MLKLHYLRDGDEIVFIENPFDKTKSIVQKDMAYIPHIRLMDDDKFPIIKELRKLHFKLKNTDNDLDISFNTRFLSYVIVNDEVKLIWFGYRIFNLINAKVLCGNDYLNIKFKIVKEISPQGYTDFQNCHFTNEVITYDRIIRNDAKPMSDYMFTRYNWTLDENKEKLTNFLKEHNQEKFIQNTLNKIRLDKLNRINET